MHFSIAAVTWSRLTRTTFSEPETAMNMRYPLGHTLPKDVDRTEEALIWINQAHLVSLPAFTRSCTVPLDKDLCFFCQEDTDEQLFKVCTQNAGETLKSAVDKSPNPAFKMRLNTCISPTDAHAVDVRYHKSCWTKHVFHATRDQGDTKSSSKVHPLQNACLIELINLVDVQTQNQADLSIDDIETAYTRMLGPDGMENHFPAFTRWWLKEEILTELPSVKSVLQKNRRKPAVLYSCTQADLTEYLASKTVEYSKESPKLVIASAAGHREQQSIGL